METEWYQARACLRHLRKKHPDWTINQLAHEIGYSPNWVRKWLKRLAGASPEDATCLCSQSRARKNPPPRIAPEVVTAILAIRDDPPEGLNRTPGPVAIKYYLPRDQSLEGKGYHLPTSTSTLWHILDRNGRILRPLPRPHEPVSRAEPLQAWQMDFKDVTTVRGGTRTNTCTWSKRWTLWTAALPSYCTIPPDLILMPKRLSPVWWRPCASTAVPRK